MAFDMDLTRLPEGLTEVALASSDSYQEALPPAPPEPGNYMLRILAAGLQMKTKDGQQVEVLDDEKYAQLKIDAIEIVQPEELQRKLYIFQKFPSKPLKNRKGASKLTDLIRAHDQSLTWTDNTDAFRVLDQTVERGGTFYGYIDWVATIKSGIVSSLHGYVQEKITSLLMIIVMLSLFGKGQAERR